VIQIRAVDAELGPHAFLVRRAMSSGSPIDSQALQTDHPAPSVSSGAGRSRADQLGLPTIWRQTFSQSRHALTHSFIISASCPSHAAAQSRHASAQAWWAYFAIGLLRAIKVAASVQNAWQSIVASCDLAW
jgi:hypothetical protein